ncbi:MAG: inositol monophosphatase family protein [Bradymonadia bacterium]
MTPAQKARILSITGGSSIEREELIQPLWNDYGRLSRVFIAGSTRSSIIVKQIRVPKHASHPRGFATSLSHQRKLRSYEVESAWYRNQNQQVNERCATPRCLDVFVDGEERFLLLEDLDVSGYPRRMVSVSMGEVQTVLRWLANFHAVFLHDTGEDLWSKGTYWHLETRPDELEVIRGTRLHRFASLIDARLNASAFQTLVHGDAKLANFCFSTDGRRVAAVDFQYVGRGCGIKDVVYFLGSCLDPLTLETREDELLATYFEELKKRVDQNVDGEALEKEWRALYSFGWADFERFMRGWSPHHHKLTTHSEEKTETSIKVITDELMAPMEKACVAAGRFVHRRRDNIGCVASKGLGSSASDVVTEVDLEAQRIILSTLAEAIQRYDLGCLAEEIPDDQSRVHKHMFFAIDPLDGTRPYVDGKSGYATAIALISNDGETLMGAVFEPASDRLYTVVRGEGVRVNGESISGTRMSLGPCFDEFWIADESFKSERIFEQVNKRFSIRYPGGAVANILTLLSHPRACYVKPPRKRAGGCAIWDVAAVSLMLEALGGRVCYFDGRPIELNRQNRVFFNDVGLVFLGAQFDLNTLVPVFGSDVVERWISSAHRLE